MYYAQTTLIISHVGKTFQRHLELKEPQEIVAVFSPPPSLVAPFH